MNIKKDNTKAISYKEAFDNLTQVVNTNAQALAGALEQISGLRKDIQTLALNMNLSKMDRRSRAAQDGS